MLVIQIGATRIYLWFSFFAVICLFFFLEANGWGLWCLNASFLHEMGHLGALWWLKSPPRELHLEYSGLRLIPQHRLHTPRQEAFVLLSGSMVNFLCFILLQLLRLPTPAGFHLMLGVFNLLPLQALDGGQLIQLLIEPFPAKKTAANAGAILSWSTALLLIFSGLFLFQKSGNFTLLLTAVYLFSLGFSR